MRVRGGGAAVRRAAAGTSFSAPFPAEERGGGGSGAERSGRAVRRFMRRRWRAGGAQCEASRRAGE